MLQARDPGLVGHVFFAKYDPHATWLDDLEPAFEDELSPIRNAGIDSILVGK